MQRNAEEGRAKIVRYSIKATVGRVRPPYPKTSGFNVRAVYDDGSVKILRTFRYTVADESSALRAIRLANKWLIDAENDHPDVFRSAEQGGIADQEAQP